MKRLRALENAASYREALDAEGVAEWIAAIDTGDLIPPMELNEWLDLEDPWEIVGVLCHIIATTR